MYIEKLVYINLMVTINQNSIIETHTKKGIQTLNSSNHKSKRRNKKDLQNHLKTMKWQ